MARLSLAILVDSMDKRAAQRRGFISWSVIATLRGMTCCGSRNYGASAEAPEEEQSRAANELLLHRGNSSQYLRVETCVSRDTKRREVLLKYG